MERNEIEWEGQFCLVISQYFFRPEAIPYPTQNLKNLGLGISLTPNQMFRGKNRKKGAFHSVPSLSNNQSVSEAVL